MGTQKVATLAVLALGLWASMALAAGGPSAAGDLFEAAHRGDVPGAMRLIRDHPELVNTRDTNGETALRVALSYGHMDVVRAIWPYTAKDNISAAAALGDLTALRAQLRANPESANEADDGGWTPLHWAADQGQAEAAALLLDGGARLVRGGPWGRDPLLVAAAEGNNECVEVFLAHGADVNAAGADGMTALHYAVWQQHYDTAALLLARGANANAQTEFGQTPLHIAAAQGNEAVVKLLLRSSADVNARDLHEATPLTSAVGEDQLGTARLLLAHGARHDMFSAAGLGDGNAVRDLLRQNTALVAERDGLDEKTPLFWAVSRGHPEAIRLLVKAGAALEARDKRGQTALHWAVFKDQRDAAEQLLALGADVNAPATKRDHETPLMYAAELGYVKMAELLLHHGAAVDLRDEWGYSALHYAARKGTRDVAALLIDRGANVSARGGPGSSTPLQDAAAGGHLSTVRLLLDRGADVAATDNDGDTALTIAQKGGRSAVARLLVSYAERARSRSGRPVAAGPGG